MLLKVFFMVGRLRMRFSQYRLVLLFVVSLLTTSPLLAPPDLDNPNKSPTAAVKPKLTPEECALLLYEEDSLPPTTLDKAMDFIANGLSAASVYLDPNVAKAALNEAAHTMADVTVPALQSGKRALKKVIQQKAIELQYIYLPPTVGDKINLKEVAGEQDLVLVNVITID